MFSMRTTALAGLLVMFAVACAPALAAIPFAANEINQLEDQDFETLVNNTGTPGAPNYLFPPFDGAGDPDTTLDVGDLLTGIFRIQALNLDSPLFDNTYPTEVYSAGVGAPPNTVTGVFVVEVLDKAFNGTDEYTFDFAPAPDAAWTYLGLTRDAANTMFRFFDDSTDPFLTLNPAGLSLANLTTVLSSANGPMIWEFGLDTGDVIGDGDGKFWRALTNTDDVTQINPQAGSFTFGLEVTAYGTGARLLPHDELDDLGFTSDGPVQLQGEGAFQGLSTDPTNETPVITDTNFYVLPDVPEPGTILMWGGMMAGIGIAALRRRKNA